MTQIFARNLPLDIQILLDDMLGACADCKIQRRLWKHQFKVHLIDLSRFPEDIKFCDYRDKNYAAEMIGRHLPPVILCGNVLLDGMHRVWAARKEGMKKIVAIDLSEIGFVCDFKPICKLKAKR